MLHRCGFCFVWEHKKYKGEGRCIRPRETPAGEMAVNDLFLTDMSRGLFREGYIHLLSFPLYLSYMASWSTKRKYGYFLAVIGVLAVLVGIPVFIVVHKPATCSDGKQNGDERGIDCGGTCARLCPADFAEARVLWSYSTRVVPGVYNALAYAQNPNQAVVAESVPYLFKLYDNAGVLVAQKTGKTFIPAGQKFAVFVGGIETGGRIPTRTTFEFTSAPQWIPGTPIKGLSVLSINVSEGSNASDAAVSPSAIAKIRNTTVDSRFVNLDAFIILFDKDDNRIAFSKTVVNSIGPNETQDLSFTWPEAFSQGVIRSEVIFVPQTR